MQHPRRRNAVGTSVNAIPAENHVRMVFLGAPAVGKTQIVSRFMGRDPCSTYLPTAEDFHRMMYSIRGHTYELEVLDTAGRVISPLMQKITIMTGDMFVVVYSLTDRKSFERAKDLVGFVEDVVSDPLRTHKGIERNFQNLMLHPKVARVASESKTHSRIIPIILVGNKLDLNAERVIPKGEASQWLRQRPLTTKGLTSVTHIEVSAKNDSFVQELFERLFTLSSLPLEMSPNLHRKVTESTYAISTQCDAEVVMRKQRNRVSLKNRLSLKSLIRPKSSEDLHFEISNEEICSTAIDSGLNSEENSIKHTENFDVVATARLNDRRPSVDTEVILALTKSQSYPTKISPNKDYSIKTFGNPFKAIKNKVNKIKQ